MRWYRNMVPIEKVRRSCQKASKMEFYFYCKLVVHILYTVIANCICNCSSLANLHHSFPSRPRMHLDLMCQMSWKWIEWRLIWTLKLAIFNSLVPVPGMTNRWSRASWRSPGPRRRWTAGWCPSRRCSGSRSRRSGRRWPCGSCSSCWDLKT